jgi:excisionase family DNA binding protein
MKNNLKELKPRLVDTEGAAVYLSLSIHTIRSWKRYGRIPYVMLGKAVRFDLLELEEWIKDNKVTCVDKSQAYKHLLSLTCQN